MKIRGDAAIEINNISSAFGKWAENPNLQKGKLFHLDVKVHHLIDEEFEKKLKGLFPDDWGAKVEKGSRSGDLVTFHVSVIY